MVMTRLFSWLQEADFYYAVHTEAVALIPAAKANQPWIDIGCGPGLVTRLAAARGYEATGIDIAPAMIAAAQRIAQRKNVRAVFRTGSFESIPENATSVVSAASLLAVLPDPAVALHSLWRAVRPDGYLLIVEPTAELTVEQAQRLVQNSLPPKRKFGLYLWAKARQGRAVNPSIFSQVPAAKSDYYPLLHGLIGAWVMRKGGK